VTTKTHREGEAKKEIKKNKRGPKKEKGRKGTQNGIRAKKKRLEHTHGDGKEGNGGGQKTSRKELFKGKAHSTGVMEKN